MAILFAIAPVCFGVESIAQNTKADLATSKDCAELLLHDLNDASLTREEKIKLLERALLRSLNKFDPCQPGGGGAGSGVAGGGNGTVGGVQGAEASESSDGLGGVQVAVESAPSGDIQGDLPSPQDSRKDPNSSIEETISTNQTNLPQTNLPKTGPTNDTTTPPNGKLPEDIPSVANDDIIAKQIRQAAIEETDPVVKAELWNEYRRYKNLPVQEVPET